MLKEEICKSYNTIKPDENAKKRMLHKIQSATPHSEHSPEETSSIKHTPKWFLRLAPVLTAVLVVTTVSCTGYFFSLRDLGIGKEEIKVISPPQIKVETEAAGSTPTEQKVEVDMIALSGVWSSPEYKACAEWAEFLQSYDRDGAILSSIGNSPTGLEGTYDAYICYTQEMADKIEEICEKYHLSKLSGIQIMDDLDALCSQAGVGDFFGNASENTKLNFEGGYVYSDGTFHMDGSALLADPSPHTTDFQLMRSMRGSFNAVTLNVGDIGQYRQWNYTTKSGDKVFLANDSTKALIIVEREKSFIVVNVLGDISAGVFDISDQTLETMADAFDFSVVP